MSIDAAVARVIEAAGKIPVDWSTIRSVAAALDIQAKSADEKAAIRQLKAAQDATRINMAAAAVQRAFLQGKPGVDGWPRRL